MITTKDLSLKIGKKTLLSDVSLGLDPGKLHLVLGANGAGKSTLIKLLSGQMKASTGSISYNSVNLNSFKVSELAKFRTVLSQSVDFAFPLKVSEVVMMGRYPHFTSQPRGEDQQIVRESIDLFEIGHLEERDYTTLSGGEKQRVQFARVIAQIWPEEGGEKYLFLDEPLTFLDVKYQFDFLHKVRGFLKNKNLTVVGVLHDLNLAARFADNLLLLKEGELVSEGEVQQVLTQENIHKAFGLKPEILEFKGRRVIEF